MEHITDFSSPVGKNEFTSLVVDVGHVGNGINYFSGGRHAAGHRLYFKPCKMAKWAHGTVRESVLLSSDQWESGFCVKLDDAQRKNPHYIKRADAALESKLEECTAAFMSRDIEALRKIAAAVHAAAFKSPSKAKAAKPAVEPVGQKLMTKSLLKAFASVGSQDGVEDPLVIAKFFNPLGAGTWYATEYDPSIRLFFGFVSIFGDHNDEWGSFSLDELTDARVERDTHFKKKPFSSVAKSA